MLHQMQLAVNLFIIVVSPNHHDEESTSVCAVVIFGETQRRASDVVFYGEQTVTAKPRPIKENERTCQLCGVVFHAFPSANRKICSSKDCKQQLASTRAKTHGESRTRLHGIWCNMKSRCAGTAGGLASEYYHDRGIRVCDEWLNSFESFRDWAMANGYAEDLTIDRRDNSEGYSPENCRWASHSQQMRNTRKRKTAKTSQYRGVSKHSQNTSWVAQGHKDGRPVNIGSFQSELEAATAYDAWAVVNYGEFASLNFPEQQVQGGVSR